jgi:hypothetical protein
VAHTPGFPVKFVGVDELMRLSSMKAAHVDVVWCRVQEIRASDESRVRGKEPCIPHLAKNERDMGHPSSVLRKGRKERFVVEKGMG